MAKYIRILTTDIQRRINFLYFIKKLLTQKYNKDAVNYMNSHENTPADKETPK
jgi:hypothetical protein